MNITRDLESKGWKIDKFKNSGIIAERQSTGKLAFFINSNKKMNKTDLMRVWNKGYHPFTYTIENDIIKYYDALFCEEVRFP